MNSPNRGRRPSDLWGAAKSTTKAAKLLVASDVPLVSVKSGTALVVDGKRVTVRSVTREGDKVTIVAEGGES